MKREQVKLVRRISGGGTVYHDPGNINFSFLLPESLYDQEKQFEVVVRALRDLGVPAVKNERNDLCVGARKFSGNAFRHSKGNSLHHGTLLLNADIEALTRFLAPPELVIETKAIASVRSQVINLEESVPGLERAVLLEALSEEFHRVYEPHQDLESSLVRTGERMVNLGANERPRWFPSSSEIEAQSAELSAWEWVFGHTPAFSRRYRCEETQVVVVVRKGVIRAIDTEDDAPEAIGDALRSLVGIPLRRDTVERTECAEPVRWLQRALLKDLW